MLNLLRTDLYRVFRSKSFYICFGILVFINIVTFGILFIMCLMSAMTFLGFGLPTQQLAYGIVIVFTMTLLGYIEKKRFRV